MREWIEGPKFCNYVEDDKRVLGQLVAIFGQFGKWRGFDNTRLNPSKTTALPLGDFDSLEEGKQAIEALFGRETVKEVYGERFERIVNPGPGREHWRRLRDGAEFEADCETPYTIGVSMQDSEEPRG